jgi:glycosyltransferase involved in cell wall biosynthesis
MEKNILILAYYSFRDPVFQSAVLPYFMNFPTAKIGFVLLTFEHDKYHLSEKEKQEISLRLKDHGITWVQSRWRSGKFKPIKKAIDFTSAVLSSLRLIRKFRISAIYSEGWPGCILGYYTAKLSNTKHIVHSFEPHADYMVEAGVWKESSWETRFVRWHDRKIALHASAILTATHLYIEKLKNIGVDSRVLYRVPSCVDLDHFKFDQQARSSIRQKYGIGEKQTVLVYLGKFGGMYMEDEAFDFFALCQHHLNTWVMIITPENPEKILSLCRKYSVDEEKVIVTSLTREEIPSYLSASDAGFVAVRQWPSKVYCSPIKTGEYLACGLPVIVPSGISDDGPSLEQLGIGLIIKSLKKNDFLEVISAWENRIKTGDMELLRNNAREYAKNDRSIHRYQRLYCQLFEKL